MLTVQDVSKAVPANLKNAVSQSLVDTVNSVVEDPMIAERVQENFITFANVLSDGKYKMTDYLNAVVYVSHKLMGDSNHDAWCKTFPDRHARLVADGKSKNQMSAYVSAYASTKLVASILEQSFIPTWILNRDTHQQAINRLKDLMLNASSEKVQCEAATSLLTNLAKPKDSNFQISVDLTNSSGMNEMNETLRAMAQRQQQFIEQGIPTKDIAGERIYQSEQ